MTRPRLHLSTLMIVAVIAGAMLWPVILVAQGIWKVDQSPGGVLMIGVAILICIALLVGVAALCERIIEFRQKGRD